MIAGRVMSTSSSAPIWPVRLTGPNKRARIVIGILGHRVGRTSTLPVACALRGDRFSELGLFLRHTLILPVFVLNFRCGLGSESSACVCRTSLKKYRDVKANVMTFGSPPRHRAEASLPSGRRAMDLVQAGA